MVSLVKKILSVSAAYRHDFNAFCFVSVAEFLCKEVKFLFDKFGNSGFGSSSILWFCVP